MRYTSWEGQKVCTIQKEYPTADKLGKPRRQHWDVAVIKSPPRSLIRGPKSYDYLRLSAVIEFGMNVGIEHLEDDIERISHPRSNVEFGFLVHLYRLSVPGAPVSGRDWSPKSKKIVSRHEIAEIIGSTELQVYYGVADLTDTHQSGLWLIKSNGDISQLANI
jgi:hypothetical protein